MKNRPEPGSRARAIRMLAVFGASGTVLTGTLLLMYWPRICFGF